LVLLAVACVALAVSGVAVAQGPPMPQPSPQHEILKRDVGTWDATMQIWPTPDAAPMTAKATEKNELLEGGMWLVSRFESDFEGMSFAGRGAFGYDPLEKKYVGGWIDSMSPYLTISKGDYDPATKTMTMIAEARDMTGKPVIQKQVSRFVDDDTRTFEIQQQGDDGTFWKMLDIQYKRRAE
jgi:hypothetical protein